MAPSRSSFVRESVPYNDFHSEMFTMSDLDIPNSGIPEGSDQKTITSSSVDVSRSSIYTNAYKNDVSKETGDTVETELSRLPEYGYRKESKIPHSSVPPNFDR